MRPRGSDRAAPTLLAEALGDLNHSRCTRIPLAPLLDYSNFKSQPRPRRRSIILDDEFDTALPNPASYSAVCQGPFVRGRLPGAVCQGCPKRNGTVSVLPTVFLQIASLSSLRIDCGVFWRKGEKDTDNVGEIWLPWMKEAGGRIPSARLDSPMKQCSLLTHPQQRSTCIVSGLSSRRFIRGERHS